MLILLLFLGFISTSNGQSLVDIVDASEVEKRLLMDENMTIIDARNPSEYRFQSLPKAINIDPNSDSFAFQISELDKKRSYIIYCNTGSLSSSVSIIMKHMDFKDVAILRDGFEGWVAGNYNTQSLEFQTLNK